MAKFGCGLAKIRHPLWSDQGFKRLLEQVA
jgi:hypothetical protein